MCVVGWGGWGAVVKSVRKNAKSRELGSLIMDRPCTQGSQKQ